MEKLIKRLRARSHTMTSLLKILIVDDDPEWHEITHETLALSSRLHHESLLARNGEEALARYQANPDLSCVILDTDLNLTHEKGWLVYDQLRAAGYQGPVLARSAADNCSEWQQRGVEFLSKSVSAGSRMLERTVCRLIEEYKRNASDEENY